MWSGLASHNHPVDSAEGQIGNAPCEAIESAVTAIAAGMKKVPWSGRVIDVREGLVYINTGAELGIQSRMEFDVYEQEEALVGPETRKALGTPDRELGALKATRVEDKCPSAEAIAGSGFKRSQVVRFKGQAEKP